MTSKLSRPFRPIDLAGDALEVFELYALGSELQGTEEYGSTGVAAVTLARDAHVTIVLVALRAGASMREHRAPSAGTALLLSGRGEFVAGADGKRAALAPGSLVAFSADLPHAVEAAEESLLLVTIGGRERPPGAERNTERRETKR